MLHHATHMVVCASALVLLHLPLLPAVLEGQSGASLSYTFRMTSEDDDPVTGRTLVSGSRARIEIDEKDGDKAGHDYLLVTDSGRTVIVVKPEEREYSVVEGAEFERVVARAMRAVDLFLTMNVDNVNISTESLGPGGNVAGFETQRFRMTQEYSLEVGMLGFTEQGRHQVITDFWVSPKLSLPHNPLIEMLSTVETALAQHEGSFVRKSAAARRSLFSGAPMKVVVRYRSNDDDGEDSSVRTIEVTSVDHAPADPKYFEIPAGYRRHDGRFSWRLRI